MTVVTDRAELPGPSGDGAGEVERGPGSRVLAWLRAAADALVVPVLALVTALAIGGLVIVFSDPDTLDSWGGFFSHPGATLSDSWNLVYESYEGLFRSSLGTQPAIGRSLVEATPLALAGLSVAL